MIEEIKKEIDNLPTTIDTKKPILKCECVNKSEVFELLDKYNNRQEFKWKCDICGSGFNNFQAQRFDNKIYCPLCYFKHENQDLQQKLDKELEIKEKAKEYIDKITNYIRKGLSVDEVYELYKIIESSDK